MINSNRNSTVVFVPDARTVFIVDIMFKFDVFLRIYSACVHIFYFVLIFKIRSMRTKTSFYAHHVNLVSFLFNLHYIVYYDYVRPNFKSELANRVMCTLSEVIWAVLKNLRTYSIALIAFYRLLALFKNSYYKFINSSVMSLLLPLWVVYAWVVGLFVVTKCSLGTTYGPLYCFDGYSAAFFNSFVYFLVHSCVGIILPTAFTVVVYVVILKKIRLVSVKYDPHEFVGGSNSAHKKRSTSSSSLSNVTVFVPANRLLKLKNYKKFQLQLSKQFLLMDVCEIVSSLMVIGLGMRYIFPNLNEYYNVVRFSLRTVNLLTQSFIPIISIVYNPIIYQRLKKWKHVFFCRLNVCD